MLLLITKVQIASPVYIFITLPSMLQTPPSIAEMTTRKFKVPVPFLSMLYIKKKKKFFVSQILKSRIYRSKYINRGNEEIIMQAQEKMQT